VIIVPLKHPLKISPIRAGDKPLVDTSEQPLTIIPIFPQVDRTKSVTLAIDILLAVSVGEEVIIIPVKVGEY
jgi:hypothetical protein